MIKGKFKSLLVELKKEAKRLGVSIVIRREKIKYPDHFGVSGHYCSRLKKISIKILGNQSRAYILAVIAHELRHAIHDNLGIYKDFYHNSDLSSKEYVMQIRSREKDLPSLAIALRAENDCNRFAVNWLKERDFPLDQNKKTYASFFQPYPRYHIWFYHLYREMKNLELKTRI